MSSITHPESTEHGSGAVGGGSAGGVPQRTKVVLGELERMTREGTPLEDALQELMLMAKGERGEQTLSQSSPKAPERKSVLDMAVYHTAARTVNLLPKLEFDTYATWYFKFRSHIGTIPGAVAHLDGIEYPAGFQRQGDPFPTEAASRGYDPELDLGLGTMFINTVGPKLNNVTMRIMRKGGGGVTYLHEAIKEHVSRSDTTTQINIQDELGAVRQRDESIQKLGDKLLGLFEKAENAGIELSERQQVVYLVRAVSERYQTRRSVILDKLDANEPITFHSALEKFKQEEQLFNNRTSADVSATARIVKKKNGTHGHGNGSAGGRGGGRSDDRHCYRCGEVGHIKRNCPKPNKSAVGTDNTNRHNTEARNNNNDGRDSIARH
ncbi:hypothetical protein A4X13_0g7777 [Tilletia indica]|uniref:Uncharacterized protein n=1 Tax=Tilletia indica TaxID=43049 RepID=A0A177T3G1_9BASI|nr:hypothetical protein A4X13_0g7777 [Tilletia indica]